MLNTRGCMKEGMNEQTNKQTYTTTKHITTLLLRSQVKIEIHIKLRRTIFRPLPISDPLIEV